MQPFTSHESRRLAAPDLTPAEAAMRTDAQQLVPRLMSELPARQSEAIRLKFQQDLSYREISRIMKVTESNVGFLIHTGIKSLREQMKTMQGVQS